MTKKRKKELLQTQFLCALIIGGNALLNTSVANAELFNGNHDEDISTDSINVSGSTVNMNGNLTVTSQSTAIKVYGTNTTTGTMLGCLNINDNKNKTIKITGDIYMDGLSNQAKLYVNFADPESYWAGNWSYVGPNGANLSFSNGATWYVTGDNIKQSVTADGGNLDFWHVAPSSKRSSAAGTRKSTLSNVGSTLNGSTFILSSNIKNNIADHITLNDVSGSNTYTVKVAYDPAMSANGTYTAASAPVILTTNNSDNTIKAGTYSTTSIEAAGLKAENISLTPLLSTNGGETKLTGLIIDGNTTNPGPAALMASSASDVELAALASWRAENNDLQKRLGDLRWDEGSAGAWMRTYNGESQVHNGTGSDINYHGIQVGYDRARAWGEGKLFTGIALSNMKGTVSSSSGNSDIDSKLFGIYGSYLGKKGHFIDAIIKYGRFSNDSTNSYNNINYTGDYATNGIDMSLEYGYHKQLKNDFYLEPQIELNYSHLNSSSYTMSASGNNGAFVQNNDVDSCIARVGINAGRNTPNGNIYLKLSGLHEFDGDTGMTATYSGTTVSSSMDGSDTWLEYGVGFNQRINKSQNIYGEITRTAFADKISDRWKANLGWRISF